MSRRVLSYPADEIARLGEMWRLGDLTTREVEDELAKLNIPTSLHEAIFYAWFRSWRDE